MTIANVRKAATNKPNLINIKPNLWGEVFIFCSPKTVFWSDKVNIGYYEEICIYYVNNNK